MVDWALSPTHEAPAQKGSPGVGWAASCVHTFLSFARKNKIKFNDKWQLRLILVLEKPRGISETVANCKVNALYREAALLLISS